MTSPRDRDTGITLVEMLVALIIFALVGMASFTTLDTILRVRARTDGRLEQIARLDRALLIFSRDMAQADPLSVNLLEGALAVELPYDESMRRYLFDDVELLRQSGAAQSDDPLDQTLIGDVNDVRFQVLDLDRMWHDSWPRNTSSEAAIAVRMSLTLGNGLTLGRIVALPDAVPDAVSE